MKRIAFLVLLFISVGGQSAFAQLLEIPATPAASDCTVSAMAETELLELSIAEPELAGSLDVSDEEPQVADVMAATDVVVMSVACTNANQQMAALTLFTDRYLTERFSTGIGPDELGHLIAASSRQVAPAAPEDQLTVEFIGDAILYEDGRIGLTVRTNSAKAMYLDLIILENVNGDWLIDEVVIGSETNPEGTPVASSHKRQKPVG